MPLPSSLVLYMQEKEEEEGACDASPLLCCYRRQMTTGGLRCAPNIFLLYEHNKTQGDLLP